jgi:hypothetical protein
MWAEQLKTQVTFKKEKMMETNAERLDRIFGPPPCDICQTPVPRASAEWSVCPQCGHNLIGIEAALIQKVRGRKILVEPNEKGGPHGPHSTGVHEM